MFWIRFFALLSLSVVWPAISYQLPDARLLPLLDAGKTYRWQTTTSGNWLLQLESAAQPGLAELQRPKRGLAGLSIDIGSLSSVTSTGYQRLTVQAIDNTRPALVITAETGQRFLAPVISPDERWLSFVVVEADGLFLELATLDGSIRKRLPERLNAVFGVQYQWLSDSSAVLVAAAPTSSLPVLTQQADSPKIRQSNAESSAQRTLQLMLETAADEQAFAQLSQSRLLHVTTDLITTVLLEAPLQAFSLSPNNRFILLQQIQRPYSQRVRYHNFTQQFSVVAIDMANVSLAGDDVSTDVALLPVHEQRSRRPGRRLISWRPDQAATLYWLETDTGKKANDKLWQWSAPFTQPAQQLYSSRWRIERVLWSASELAVIYESSGEQQRARLFPQGFAAKSILWFQRHNKDLQAEPGQPLLDVGAEHPLLHLAVNNELLLTKRDHVTAADSLLHLNPHTLQTTVVWQSRSDVLEQLVRILPNGDKLITRQTSQQPPELFFVAPQREQRLVARAHPAPAYQQISSEVIHYQRADGVALSGRLLLPAGYRVEMGPLPVLIWAYPREFASAELAEQQQAAAQQFVALRLTSAQPYVALGYAVFDQVSMPIIADEDKLPNDDFLAQLTANAEAAVKTLIELGIAETDNIAIGGHSYGAFMVANLLAHTQLFQAGIARSGAYNRSLTPFGFQTEKRNLWQQPELYQQMSPFLHADKITAPLLLIHGEADSNSGTFPSQSVRLFEALQGLGKPARLVILPYEGHHYRARESLMHLLWEQGEWLKQHLRQTPAMQKLLDNINNGVANSAQN